MNVFGMILMGILALAVVFILLSFVRDAKAKLDNARPFTKFLWLVLLFAAMWLVYLLFFASRGYGIGIPGKGINEMGDTLTEKNISRIVVMGNQILVDEVMLEDLLELEDLLPTIPEEQNRIELVDDYAEAKLYHQVRDRLDGAGISYREKTAEETAGEK